MAREDSQSVIQVVLPNRRVPLEQLLPAPDVVHEDVQAPALGIDPLHERLDLISLEMVDGDRDPNAAGFRHELGRLLDRLRSVVLRGSVAGAAARAVHGRCGLSKRNGRAAPGASTRAGDERNPALESRG